MCGAGRSPRGVCRLAGPALENQQQEDGTTTWENHVEARIGPREVTFEPRVYGSDVRYAKRPWQKVGWPLQFPLSLLSLV